MGKTTELDSGTLRRLVPSWLKEFPIGRTMLAETDARTAAERGALAQQLDKVRDEQRRENFQVSASRLIALRSRSGYCARNWPPRNRNSVTPKRY